MRTHTLFKEYIWLINTIAKYKKISLEEINQKWINTDMSEGVEFSRRTFIRHKNAIEEMFGVFIDCDKRDGFKYYIDNIEVLRENTIQNWLLSTLAVSNIVGDSIALQDRIIIESIPVQNEYLSTIINAMKNKQCLVITYLKYGENTPKDVLVEPYCLKMFRQRWYVISHFKDGQFKTYSIDRIKSVRIDNTKFKLDPNFDAHSFFDDYYGILRLCDHSCETVQIRAFGKERFYMRDLPIHHTQYEIFECEEYADFECKLYPTSDFITHLLSRSTQIKIMKPTWLAERVRNIALEIAKIYTS